jgi:hypothetical protein
MTVKELIEQLEKVDPEARVFVKGYEGGFNNATCDCVIRQFVLDYHDEWYYGKHEVLDEVYGIKEAYKTIKGIIL